MNPYFLLLLLLLLLSLTILASTTDHVVERADANPRYNYLGYVDSGRNGGESRTRFHYTHTKDKFDDPPSSSRTFFRKKKTTLYASFFIIFFFLLLLAPSFRLSLSFSTTTTFIYIRITNDLFQYLCMYVGIYVYI